MPKDGIQKRDGGTRDLGSENLARAWRSWAWFIYQPEVCVVQMYLLPIHPLPSFFCEISVRSSRWVIGAMTVAKAINWAHNPGFRVRVLCRVRYEWTLRHRKCCCIIHNGTTGW